VHLATISRLQGNADKAADLVERALEISPDSVPAKLQKWLVLLDKGVTSSARLELDGLKGKVGDKYLEATLEARMLIAEERHAEAIQTLSATIEADARRVDAIFLAGAAAAKSRKDGKAWEFCIRRGLRADPHSRPVPSLTHLFVRPADLLKPAVGAYAALVKDDSDDPSPSLCEGLVAWFSEDFATADRHFARVVNIDLKNPDAFAYRSLIALRKKDVGGALKFASKAVDGGKNNPLAWYAQAQAHAQANKIDAAKAAARSSLKYGPQLLGPKVILGDAEASSKNGDDARRVLTSVLLVDPLYRDAKRVLYKHQL
jgi:tetratricopeptide (TPR) repeat protein